MLWLEEMYLHSRKKLFPVVLYGPRRVGKTRLIRNFLNGKQALYIYVNETKSSHALALEVANQIKEAEKLDDFISLDTWDKILRYLIEKSSFELVVFDEFQNFLAVDQSVFGMLQNLLDRYENSTKKMLLFLGSSVGVMKEVFEDNSAPLYGRMKATLKVSPLLFEEVCLGMHSLGYADQIDVAEFFFVFGGYPKYLVAIEDFELGVKRVPELLEYFFFRDNAVLQNEVRDILRSEFGSKGGQYYSILEAIATGHTKLSEIASYIGMPATSASSFLTHLCEYYELVERKVPLMRAKSKDTCYTIKNPLFRFWFRFVRPGWSQLELGRYDGFQHAIKSNFVSYAGREFERLAEEHLRITAQKKIMNISELGGWWHDEREIDIVTLGKTNSVWECKWSNVSIRDAILISKKLRDNAAVAGLEGAETGLFARKVEAGVADNFDYVITLKDIAEGRFPNHKRL